jgi:predicted ATPase
LLRRIRPANLLSFGPDTPALELENLNVLIGPNGSGKSNLIEALALMRATPVPPQATSDADVRGVVRRGGGVHEWVWKGARGQAASVELAINCSKRRDPLRHAISFRGDEQGFRLESEVIDADDSPVGLPGTSFRYEFGPGRSPRISWEGREQKVPADSFHATSSILAQYRDPLRCPELAHLADAYERFRIYREWVFGRNTVFREPQKADMPNDRLEEDFSNLGLFLSRLRKTPKAKKDILDALVDLYDGLTDFEVIAEGGSVQVFFSEGNLTIPAQRLSDGALRYLCLLAILCDPAPAPLICIEEPELGLHPDILPKLADLLVAASQRTQIIVTTHSDILVDAMTDWPEAIVVCEKHEGQTEMRRLRKADLAAWLDKYRLGQLWTKGQIGGTRW